MGSDKDCSSNGGDDDGCGVGMFVEVDEGAKGGELYMPMSDRQWHW